MSAAVSELAKYQMTRKVLVVTRICGGGNAPKDLDGIRMPNGTVYTGYYSYKNWNSLSQEDKDKVLAEWKKRGIDKSCNSNKEKGNKCKVAEIQALAESMEEMKISELMSKQQDDMGNTQGIITPPLNDASNSFGGRQAKADTKNT